MMEEQLILNLLKRAGDVSNKAYAPYSEFRVGCAILLADGRVIEGVNIENASYPVSICAERSAMAQVVSNGDQHLIRAVAVVTKPSPPGSPCGMCRQFLQEFLQPDTPIILGNFAGEWFLTNMTKLLPLAFDKSSLI